MWFSRESGAGERLALLTGEDHSLVQQDAFPNHDLVEIKKPCIHFEPKIGCSIYKDPDRPALCSEFPDNLFNRDESGQLVLDDDHARGMIDLYFDYCLAVQRLGRIPPGAS